MDPERSATRHRAISVCLCLFLLLPCRGFPALPARFARDAAQEERGSQRPEPRTDYRKIFANIEHGFASGSAEAFSQYMAAQVRLNLRGGESGTYSASQAHYILESYFKTRKLVNFEFNAIGDSDSNPYATGSAGFNYKGNRELVQVYVSLSLTGGAWAITQINIY